MRKNNASLVVLLESFKIWYVVTLIYVYLTAVVNNAGSVPEISKIVFLNLFGVCDCNTVVSISADCIVVVMLASEPVVVARICCKSALVVNLELTAVVVVVTRCEIFAYLHKEHCFVVLVERNTCRSAEVFGLWHIAVV